MTLISNKVLPLTLVLAGSMALAACSSKPSPWTESSSPWDNRAEQVETEPMAIEEIEPMPVMEEETIEPIGIAAAEEEVMPVEAAEMAEEPMIEAEPVMIEELAPVSTEGSLADQPAGNFAVQVVASSSMEQLKFFAGQHQLSDQWVAETMVDGKVWYVLMSGVYASKAEATQALAEVQDIGTDPWIRTIGSIQAVMN